MAETIYKTVENWLKTYTAKELLDFAYELDDPDCLDWAYRIEVDEAIYMEVSDANGDIEALIDVVNWARKLGDAKYLDINFKPYDEDEILHDIKSYYLDALVDEVIDGIRYNGLPDDYSSLDTEELFDEFTKCPEWIEKYGEYWDDED